MGKRVAICESFVIFGPLKKGAAGYACCENFVFDMGREVSRRFLWRL
jgi:hypothetical protein